jgi:hypothetical protein
MRSRFRSVTWEFDCPKPVTLDEEIIGLGKYGYTLTIVTSDALPEDPSEEDDEDADLEERWTPRFVTVDDGILVATVHVRVLKNHVLCHFGRPLL